MNHPNRSKRWQMTPEQVSAVIDYLTGGNQSELARLVGVDGRTVRRWIAGDLRVPKPITILLKALKIMTPEQRQQLNNHE